MMKKIISAFCGLMLMVSFGASAAFAEDVQADEQKYNANLPRVVDEADLLTDMQELNLTNKIENIIQEYDFDVVIHTVSDYRYSSSNIVFYSRNFFENRGYGAGNDKDGIIFVVSMADRSWEFETFGYGEEIFDEDYGTKFLEDDCIDKLSDGDYYDCFSTFTDDCELFAKEARENKPYSKFHRVWNSKGILLTLKKCGLISLGIAVTSVVVLCVALIKQMKTVMPKPQARDYLVRDSFKLNFFQDTFLYSTTSRIARSKGSSGGRGRSTHSSHGRGGHF